MYNSARHGKKKIGGWWRFSAVSPPFLRSFRINIIKATAIPKLTAVTHFWLSSCVSFIGFKKWHIRPPPLYFKIKLSLSVNKNVKVLFYRTSNFYVCINLDNITFLPNDKNNTRLNQKFLIFRSYLNISWYDQT